MMKLRSKIVTFVLLALIVTAGAIALPELGYASTASNEVTKGMNATNAAGTTTLTGAIRVLTNVLLFIIGAVSVIMIIIGGIRYTTSNGDSSQISAAKNTILYAVIGLVVALLAAAITNFVIDQFGK